MKKIAHICPDEKFIDYAIHNFQSVNEVLSDFYIVSNSKLKHVKSERVTKISSLKFILYCLLGKFRGYDLVVLHSLRRLNKLQLLLTSQKSKILWVGFGYDYRDSSVKYLNKTEEIISVEKVKKSIFDSPSVSKHIYSKIDYFAPVLDVEFERVKNKFLGFKPKYIDWNYGSSNSTLVKFKKDYVDGGKILIGNSAAPTNNHVDVLDLINKSLSDCHIVLPLSYGDFKYRDKLKKIITEEFNHFEFDLIEDFLPVEQYFNKVKECSIAIFGYTEQAALGNIVVMLYLGAKVFLYDDNYLLDYLKNKGFTIYAMSEFGTEYSSGLGKNKQIMNKKLVEEITNVDLVSKKTKTLISTCLD